MPQIDQALNGWGMSIILKKIIQAIVNGDVVTTKEELSTVGVDQPMSGEQLMMKPEGQRNWEWRIIHDYYCSLNLHAGDKIERYNGVVYKVNKVNDYSLNNYMEYEIVNDFLEGA
jgi:hypothetical protein